MRDTIIDVDFRYISEINRSRSPLILQTRKLLAYPDGVPVWSAWETVPVLAASSEDYSDMLESQ